MWAPIEGDSQKDMQDLLVTPVVLTCLTYTFHPKSVANGGSWRTGGQRALQKGPLYKSISPALDQTLHIEPTPGSEIILEETPGMMIRDFHLLFRPLGKIKQISRSDRLLLKPTGKKQQGNMEGDKWKDKFH